MALTATLFRCQIELADIDRGKYESLDLRVACHPSEDAERLVVRVLARAIADEEGLEFGRGLSHADEPALWSHTSTGEVERWIDVGAPGAERLHRASKRASHVQVFTHKVGHALRKEWSSRAIHRSADLEVVQVPVHVVAGLAAGLDRSVQWHVTLNDGSLSVSFGDNNVEGPLVRQSLEAFLAAPS